MKSTSLSFPIWGSKQQKFFPDANVHFMPWNTKVDNYNFYLEAGGICSPPVYAN